jgi:hypothetical protein
MKCKIIIITIIDHEIVWFDQWHMIAFTHVNDFIKVNMFVSKFGPH